MFKARVFLVLVFSLNIVACYRVIAMKEQGEYRSPGKVCTALVKASPYGGFLQLFIRVNDKEVIHMADDVTGFMWIGENSLIFSSSPIYGKPGVYKTTCEDGEIHLKVIVKAKNINSAYPDGADYFELKGARGDQLEFYYGSDVDSIDFNEYRTEKYLQAIRLP